MRFVVVRLVPDDGRKDTDVMINVDAIRYIRPTSDGAEIVFAGGHPNAIINVADGFDALRDRLRDLELPMPRSV